MYKAKERFLWFAAGELIKPEDVDESWIVKGHVELATKADNKEPEVKVKEPEKKDAGVLDVNKDGKVDMKDVKAAGSVLKKLGSRLKGKKKGKKK